MKRLLLICMAAAGLCAATRAADGTAAGKIAPKPLFRDPVFDGAADPVLVRDAAQNRWLMFYTNRRASAADLPGVTWVHGTRIGIAESRDGGAAWKYLGTAAIPYGKPDYTHWAPDIVSENGEYHMFLTVVPGIFTDWNAPREIVHLTSGNLKDWKFESALKLASTKAIDPSLLQLSDKTWRMWYKNELAKDGSIYYADSPDLKAWTDKGVALPGSKGEGPKAFRWKNSYWLVVDVWDGLAVYRSDDCLHWIAQETRLVQQPGTVETDRAKGNHADVVVSGGRAWLFYFTHQGGADAAGKERGWSKRSVIQVAELEYRDGLLICDREKPAHVDLQDDSRWK